MEVYDCSTLMLCVLNNDLKCASKLLLKKKCEVLSEINTKNNEGNTVLHIACRDSLKRGSIEMVKFLLENGADLHAKNNNNGWTPLHYATVCSSTDTSTVELLLRNGADPNVKDNAGRTPLHIAANFSNHHGSSLKTVEVLLQNNANPNVRTKGYWTPLHNAVLHAKGISSVETVELLLKNGADPNARTCFDMTPIHMVKYDDNLVKFLLRRGATPIDKKTQIFKLEIDIDIFVEANKKLEQRILLLEEED